MNRPLALAIFAALAAPVLAQDATHQPVWTQNAPGGVLYYDPEIVVLGQYLDLRVLATTTGQLRWEKRLERQPSRYGACSKFVATLIDGTIRCFGIADGAELMAVEGITAMEVLAEQMYATKGGAEVWRYAPGNPKGTRVATIFPYERFEEPTKGAHFGDVVVFRVSPPQLSSFDFARGKFAWSAGVDVLRFERGPQPGLPPGEVFDSLISYYARDPYLVVHGSHATLSTSTQFELGQPVEYMWFLESRKGNGPKVQIPRMDTDARPARMSWIDGDPKPYFVVSHAQKDMESNRRFDLYAVNGQLKVRTRYLPYDQVVMGAKGQMVLRVERRPLEWEVVTATAATKSLWKGTGRVLPRLDENAPYLSLDTDDQGQQRLVTRSPADGAELASLPLPAGAWDPLVLGDHYLLRQRNNAGAIVWRVDPLTLEVTRRFTLPEWPERMILLPSGVTALVRCPRQLCLLELADPIPPKKGR